MRARWRSSHRTLNALEGQSDRAIPLARRGPRVPVRSDAVHRVAREPLPEELPYARRSRAVRVLARSASRGGLVARLGRRVDRNAREGLVGSGDGLASRRAVRERVGGSLCAVGERPDAAAGARRTPGRRRLRGVARAASSPLTARTGPGRATRNLAIAAPRDRPDHALALERRVAERDPEEPIVEIDAAGEARDVRVEAPAAGARPSRRGSTRAPRARPASSRDRARVRARPRRAAPRERRAPRRPPRGRTDTPRRS